MLVVAARTVTNSEWTVDAADAGTRLDKFLAAVERLGSRSRAAAALDRGKVFLNGAETFDAALLVSLGDVVRIWADRPGTARRPAPLAPANLGVVYEDDLLIVVNKPAGLLSVPLERKSLAPSAFSQIELSLRSRGKRRPFVVHRIDQDTSGLVLFAKDARTQALLKGQFRRHEPVREYWAVVYGRPEPPEGIWRDHLVWDTRALIQKRTHRGDPEGEEALSRYRTLEVFRDASLLEVRLHTGKRNQIRLQARLRGHTLVGERRYVVGNETMAIDFPRHALHAYRLAFEHPGDGRECRVEAPLPADFRDLLARLRQ
jgi:23S rRNA pseudouridine1911/1915/1917 synthase